MFTVHGSVGLNFDGALTFLASYWDWLRAAAKKPQFFVVLANSSKVAGRQLLRWPPAS